MQLCVLNQHGKAQSLISNSLTAKRSENLTAKRSNSLINMTKRNILAGVSFGLMMWIMMEIVPIFTSSKTVSTCELILTFIFWMIGGFVFAFINSKSDKNTRELLEEQKRKLEELEKNVENIDYMAGSNPDDFINDKNWENIKNEKK